MTKAAGAFLTIGELSEELGVAQHILRYWETRFPQLRPLQRSGNRRYYRPADVAVARRINLLLNVEGFTVRGAQRALLDPSGKVAASSLDVASSERVMPPPSVSEAVTPQGRVGAQSSVDPEPLIAKLQALRLLLAQAINGEAG
jgi:DNA-binding transcriptional MerR regulator